MELLIEQHTHVPVTNTTDSRSFIYKAGRVAEDIKRQNQAAQAAARTSGGTTIRRA